MRNHHELRYLVTPANLLWSTGAVLSADARGATRPRKPVGLDARPGGSWTSRTRPLVVVLVVGETARAANWGLSGYARQTTPELAKAGVANFPDVTSCGTNTETSLPCMFAPVGRRHYDEAHIRGEQSLLHVLARAGVGIDWRDNQSGCKGVCDGLPAETVDVHDPTPPQLVLVVLGMVERGGLGVGLALLLARVGVLEDVQALGVGGHDPVLDPVVDHLDEVAGAARSAVQVPALGGARRPGEHDRADRLEREGLEVGVLHRVRVAGLGGALTRLGVTTGSLAPA